MYWFKMCNKCNCFPEHLKHLLRFTYRDYYLPNIDFGNFNEILMLVQIKISR